MTFHYITGQFIIIIIISVADFVNELKEALLDPSIRDVSVEPEPPTITDIVEQPSHEDLENDLVVCELQALDRHHSKHTSQ